MPTAPQVVRQRCLMLVSPTSASTASDGEQQQPGLVVPVSCLDKPRLEARKNPPTPPVMPTRPVITPISWRKRCGTSWNTEPLPMPNASMAQANSASAAYTLCGRKLTDDQRQRGERVHDAQRLDAADAIGERAADRPHERAEEHAGRGEVAGLHGIETVVGVEVDRERGGEPDEAAERHGVEEHEPPRVAHAQHREVLVELLRRRRGRAVLRGEQIDDERDGERHHGEAEHVVPADQHGEAGREQRGEHGAGIAGAGDAERSALVLRRIPARGERQRDGERRAGDAEHEAERERALIALDADEPGDGEADDDDDLADDAGELGSSRSTRMPNTTRSSAPASTGSATMKPFCAALRPRSADICTARAPSSTQTMKLMSK